MSRAAVVEWPYGRYGQRASWRVPGAPRYAARYLRILAGTGPEVADVRQYWRVWR